NEQHLELLLKGAEAVLALKKEARFVLVQHGWGGGGFARTLHLETLGLTTCIVHVPPGHAPAVEWIFLEASAASGFTEVHFDVEGRRREPRLRWLPPSSRNGLHFSKGSEQSSNIVRVSAHAPGARSLAHVPQTSIPPEQSGAQFPIGPQDILLVSGGGKGIAA